MALRWVPKHVGIVIIVMNCISFSVFVDVSVDSKNIHGVDNINLHITRSVFVLH